MHPTPRCVLALAISALVLTLPACKKAQDAAVNAAIEHATGAKVERNGNEVTVKTDQGELHVASAENGGSVALPASFPKDVQLPAQYKVNTVMETGGAQIVSLNTQDAMGTLFNSLSSGMEGKGWKRELATQTSDGGALSFSKDNHNVAYYLARNENGSTDLNINITAATQQ